MHFLFFSIFYIIICLADFRFRMPEYSLKPALKLQNSIAHTYDHLVKLTLKSDRANFVAAASTIEGLLHLPNVRATQYKLEPERLTCDSSFPLFQLF